MRVMVLPTRGAQGEKGRDPPPQPKLHHELVRFVWPNPFSPSSMLGPEKEVAALWMVRCRTCELDAKALLLVVLPADMLTRRLAPQAKKIGTLRRLLGAKVSPDDEAVQVTYNDDGFVDVTMSRPDMHNAFSDRVIKRFSNVFIELRARSDIRGVMLRSTGKSFCAGADLDWMRRAGQYSFDENVQDAVRLSSMLRTLDQLPHPTIAVVQGAAYGGGVGLISCCDIAVAVESATFALSEAKLGLTPATISPYVVARIGQRNARRFFLTAERFDAAKAKEIGLVHETAADEAELEAAVATFKKRISDCAPSGIRASKSLVFAVADQPVTSDLIEDTARRLAKQRMSDEGRDGVAAFLEKRKPSWKA